MPRSRRCGSFSHRKPHLTCAILKLLKQTASTACFCLSDWPRFALLPAAVNAVHVRLRAHFFTRCQDERRVGYAP